MQAQTTQEHIGGIMMSTVHGHNKYSNYRRLPRLLAGAEGAFLRPFLVSTGSSAPLSASALTSAATAPFGSTLISAGAAGVAAMLGLRSAATAPLASALMASKAGKLPFASALTPPAKRSSKNSGSNAG